MAPREWTSNGRSEVLEHTWMDLNTSTNTLEKDMQWFMETPPRHTRQKMYICASAGGEFLYN